MGKAGRWLRSFFVYGRKGRRAKDRDKQADDFDSQSVLSAALPTPESTPSAREKRRWSFRRQEAAEAGGAAGGHQGPLAPSSSQCFSNAELQQDQHAGAVAVPEASDAAGTAVHSPLPPVSGRSGGGRGGDEVAAATRIQSAFRSYLARKALRALRGMVRLQAVVRGQLVRRQASATLRRMLALVDAQVRARAERMRLLEDDDGRRLAAATTPPSRRRRRRSPQHARSRKPPEAAERSSEESVVKTGEVDDGARRGAGSWNPTPYQQRVSPTPTDASERTLSGRFDDASEPSSRRAPPFPNYMAVTESSRAKARSLSAPRQRLAASSPSPSRGERSPSGRRRASLDPLDLLGPRAAAAATAHWGFAGRVERCASRARRSLAASAGRLRSGVTDN